MKSDLLNSYANDLIGDETISHSLKTLWGLIETVIDSKIKSLNVELYKDMSIIKINPVKKESTDEVDYYTYDVWDADTEEVYEGIMSKSEPSDGYSIGDLVRVYISNIIYIGFKI